MNALPNCCSYSAVTVSPRFRQFTCGPYDPRRQLPSSFLLMALLSNSFAYFSTTCFGYSFGPLSGRGYNYINGKLLYCRKGIPFIINLIKYIKYCS